MNEKQAEIQLVRALASTCAQFRRNGTSSVAKMAIRWEEKLSREVAKLEQAESREAAAGAQPQRPEAALVA